jgi:hypothetical protein
VLKIFMWDTRCCSMYRERMSTPIWNNGLFLLTPLLLLLCYHSQSKADCMFWSVSFFSSGNRYLAPVVELSFGYCFSLFSDFETPHLILQSDAEALDFEYQIGARITHMRLDLELKVLIVERSWETDEGLFHTWGRWLAQWRARRIPNMLARPLALSVLATCSYESCICLTERLECPKRCYWPLVLLKLPKPERYQGSLYTASISSASVLE